MEKHQQYIEILIGKLISGNATQEEIQELEAWKTASAKNEQLFKNSKKAWDRGEAFISEASVRQDKSTLKATYSRYLLHQMQKIRRQSFYYKMAAILTFPVALALGWYFTGATGEKKASPRQFCEVISPKGHVSRCILPDGTEVWINTNSSLTYDAASFNQNTREIQLNGEAYFKVTSNEENPFRVITPHADVEVTGTAFNVMAYPDEDRFEAVLTEGKIQLQFKTANQRRWSMEAGQRAIFNLQNEVLEVQEVDAAIFTSWRNGELLFKDATLYDLVKELERIYDIHFYLTPQSLGDFRFRGMFSYNNNLIEALEKIKKTSGIDYYIENKEVWLKKSN